MKNGEGWLLLISGDLEPFGLEGGEQAILPRRQCRGIRNEFSRFECAARRRGVLGLRLVYLFQTSPHLGRIFARRCLVAAQSERCLAGKHVASGLRYNPAIAIPRILGDQLHRVKLIKYAAPCGQVELLANPEGRQKIVAMPPERAGCSPDEEIGEMCGKESPCGAVNGGQHFLRRDFPAEMRAPACADIAIAAGRRVLAKSGQQSLAPACRSPCRMQSWRR